MQSHSRPWTQTRWSCKQILILTIIQMPMSFTTACLASRTKCMMLASVATTPRLIRRRAIITARLKTRICLSFSNRCREASLALRIIAPTKTCLLVCKLTKTPPSWEPCCVKRLRRCRLSNSVRATISRTNLRQRKVSSQALAFSKISKSSYENWTT